MVRIGEVTVSPSGLMQIRIRCPFCLDSERSQLHAHFSLRADGAYYCYRCGEGGKFSATETLEFWPDAPIAIPEEPDQKGSPAVKLPELIQPGPGSFRLSALKRFHLTVQQGLVDVFQMRTSTGQILGFHLRPSWMKEYRTFGKRGLGYVGERALIASLLRLVEGPYDVLTPMDVCTFGFPSRRQLLMLRGYPLLLCPDGDVWTSLLLKERYFKRIFSCHDIAIAGVEKLPARCDPDEVPLDERKRLSTEEINTLRKECSDVGYHPYPRGSSW